MRGALAIVATSAFFLIGCAGLSLRPDDSGGVTAAKVGTRVLLGVTTFGISEIAIAHNRGLADRERYLESLWTARGEALARMETAETPLELEKSRLALEAADREIARMTGPQPGRQSTICLPLANGGVYCRH